MSLLLVAAAPAPAASRQGDDEIPRLRPAWRNEFAYAGANALLGGITAALTQFVRGGSPWPAFATGAAGGAAAYAGRRVATQEFDGAGLLGRQLSAAATSLSRNAADGIAPLSRLVLPLGPVRLYVRTDRAAAGGMASLKLDLPTTAAMLYLLLQPRTRLDAGSSFSSGALVFVQRESWADRGWDGVQFGGVIRLRGNPEDPAALLPQDIVLTHELVHVLQDDFTFLLWGDALEDWLAARHPTARLLDRYVDPGAQLLLWGAGNALIPHDQRPWEHEAWFLSPVNPRQTTPTQSGSLREHR